MSTQSNATIESRSGRRKAPSVARRKLPASVGSPFSGPFSPRPRFRGSCLTKSTFVIYVACRPIRKRPRPEKKGPRNPERDSNPMHGSAYERLDFLRLHRVLSVSVRPNRDISLRDRNVVDRSFFSVVYASRLTSLTLHPRAFPRPNLSNSVTRETQKLSIHF